MWGVFAKPFRNIERIFPTKQEAVSRMVDLCKTMPNIKRITIFGSAVTAGCNPWSDIDIYFETDTPLQTYPVVLGDDVFDNWSNFTAEGELLEEIKKKGIVVYERGSTVAGGVNMENTARSDEERIPMELINGKIVMMSPRPRVDHTRVSGEIYRIFSTALKGKRCEAFPDGVDVYLDEKNHFVPDAMIVCDPSRIKPTHIEGAPTLVVEVLSPRTQIYDRGAKMQAYAAAGVQEYWIVDPLGKSVEIYRPQDGRMEIQRVYTYYSPEEIAENATAPERFRLTDEEKEQDIYVGLCGGFHVLLADVFERVLNHA